MTPFDYSLGTAQGRMEAVDAPEGDYVFELGHVGAETQARIAVGDYSEVSQSIAHGAEEFLVRTTIKVVEPDDPSASVAWDVVGYVDAVEFFRRRLQPLGRALTLTDLALSLVGGTTPTTIAFRLLAVTP
jgi:hypothetical protein